MVEKKKSMNSMNFSQLKALLYKEYLTNKKSILSLVSVQIAIPITLTYLLLVYVPYKFDETTKSVNKNVTATLSADSSLGVYCPYFGNIYYYPENNFTSFFSHYLNRMCPTLQVIALKTKQEYESKLKNISSNELRNNSDLAVILFKDVRQKPRPYLDYDLRPIKFSETDSLYRLRNQPDFYLSNSKPYVTSGFIVLQSFINVAFFETVKLPLPAGFGIPSGNELPDIDIFDGVPFMTAVLIYYSAFVSMALPLVVFINRVLDEKQTEMKKLLKLMAMRELEYWLAKIIFTLLTFVLLNAVIINFVFDNTGDRMDVSLLFVVLIIYCFSSTFLTMALSTFFNFAIYGIAAFLAVQILSSFPLWWFLKKPGLEDWRLFQGNNDLPEAVYLLFCVIIPPNYSLILSLLIIVEGSNYAYALKHLPSYVDYTPHWRNIFNVTPGYQFLTLGHIMIATVISCVMWLLIFIFLNRFFDSNDCLSDEANAAHSSANESQTSSDENEVDSRQLFEEEPKYFKPGIIVSNLTKKFEKDKVAVNNVSLNLYFGQITVLLGHNGAGKTTLMNIMTGLLAPTTGNVLIDGFNVVNERDNARRKLGLCPQRDLLFENFTVEEHLYIFAILKGFPEKELKKEIVNVLKLLNLTEKQSLKAKSLSGGMRRKLQLGIAIVGGCNILVLDEPSSGLDIESRRLIWDLLRSLRKNFLILMTTHHMEEADCLADRIIIMADGRIKCIGSSSFLKNLFNIGHKLRILSEREAKETIEEFVNANCEGANLENETSKELIFNIPSMKSSRLYAFCKLLESHKEVLGIQSYGLNLTSLDDVFVSSYRMFTENRRESSPEVSDSFVFQRTRKTSNFTMFIALFLKRFQADRKRWPTFVLFLCMNILFSLYGLYVFYHFVEGSYDRTKEFRHDLNFSDFGYTQLTGLCSEQSTNFCDRFRDTGKDYGINFTTINSSVADYAKNLIKQRYEFYREKVVLAFEVQQTPKIWYSKQAKHSLPIGVNLLFNTFLKQAADDNNATIRTAIHTVSVERSDKARNRLFQLPRNVYIVPYAMVYSMLFAACFSSSLLTSERVTKAKLLQYMSGVTPLAYWASNIIYDSVYLFVVFTPFWIILYSLPQQVLIPNMRGGMAILISYIGFVLSSASINYLASQVFSKPSTAVVTLLLFNTVPATIFNEFFMYRKIFQKFDQSPSLVADALAQLFEWGASMSNFWLFSEVIVNELRVTNTIHLCSFLSNVERHLSCQYEALQDCCRTCNDCYNENFNPFQYSEPGDLFELLWIYVLFVGSAVISIALEFRLFYMECCNEKSTTLKLDSDVQEESEKVELLIADNAENRVLFFCHKLSKIFKGVTSLKDISCDTLKSPHKFVSKFVAVNRLSFSIQKNEFFGFLGVNGAGKTTTFRMLTGDLIPTAGNVYLSKYNLRDNFREYQQEIGYCPQQNILLEYLTGRQTLEFFARVRGVPKSKLTQAVNEMLLFVDLVQYADIPTSVYSGGNMRKLALGIALTGCPVILMLDEPTSAVDPVARRKLWKAIDNYKKVNNGSVILSSHSMDECEALCNRIGILARGTLQCIGSIQHLKSKFCRGFIVHIKLNMNDNKLEQIDASIKENFPNATVVDEHIPLIVYQIEDSNVSLSNLFKVMEMIKNSFDFEEYNVSQTTLEQLFLKFSTQNTKQ